MATHRKRSMGRRGIARHSALGLIVVMSMLVAACADTDTSLRIGMQRSAIDLAFTDEEIDPPAARVILRELAETSPAAPPTANAVGQEDLGGLEDIPPPEPDCPTAPPSAVITEAVVDTITTPPQEGVYTYQLRGSLSITIAGQSVPAPPLLGELEREVRNVREAETPTASERTAGSEGAASIAYDVHQTIGSTETVWTYHLMTDEDAREEVAVHMERLERRTEDETVVFEPGPNAYTQWGDTIPGRRSATDARTGATALYRNAAPGEGDWRVEALDDDTRMSYILDHGRIAQRETVDLCGELVDTYRSETTEQMQRVETNEGEEDYYIMQTHEWDGAVDLMPDQEQEDPKPNIRHFATHKGPIPVKEDLNFTEVLTTEVEGQNVPVTVVWNYTLLLMDLEPDPLPEESEE